MIAFLRFIGLINAAVWLGAAVFVSVVAGPAAASSEMQQLLGAKNFPFFSGAITQIFLERYFIFLGVAVVIALAHLIAEWLYMGKPARKISSILLGILIVFVLLGGFWLQPHLQNAHARRYAPNLPVAERESAARSFRFWHAGFLLVNVSMIAGLVVYTWRIANPSDAPRFISSVKFRG